MLNKKLLALIFSCISLLSIQVSADFDLGMEYYQQGAFEKAHAEFLQSARYGDAPAQFNLAAMYYRGEFVKKDIIQSYAWFALAAEAQDPQDKTIPAKLYKKFTDAEKKQADEAYKILSEQYSPQQIEKNLLPSTAESGRFAKPMRPIKITVPNFPIKHIQTMPDKGIVDIIYTVDKHGITRDHLVYYSSNKYFEEAAVNALRQWQYEPTIINNKAVDINGVQRRFIFLQENQEYKKEAIDKVATELREKAIKGDANDKFSYAYFIGAIASLSKGTVLHDNPNEWFVKSANDGNALASYVLGRNILYGDMCTADSAKSMGWLLKAAQQNVTNAQYMLALESFSGAHFEKNEEKAFYWLKRAASKNYAAQFRYAWILSTHPDATKRNGALAASLIEKIDDDYLDQLTYFEVHAAVAAENGDFKSAVKWAKKAKKDTEKLKLPEQIIDAQLASYQNKQAWREAL